MSDDGLEALLRRDRYVVFAALLALTALAWSYLLWLSGHMAIDATSMGNMAMDGMAMGTAPALTPWMMELGLACIMWTVMMVGMMTPSVAPVVLLYARVARHAATNGKPFAATGWFAGGYFLAWTGFSVVAAAAQVTLRSLALLTPMLASANHFVGAFLLIVAGAYQWSRLKGACLGQCRAPLEFIQRHGGFKAEAAGSLQLGLRHGLHCIGCCWAFMLLLFVGGVMNLVVIAALTVLVAFEKLTPFGAPGARISGVLLIAAALWMLMR